MTRRQEKFSSLLQSLAAEWIEQNAEGGLVTTTNIFLPPDLMRAVIYISVLPEEKETEVAANLENKAGELRHFLSEKLNTRYTPEIKIELDPGRHTRELIDRLA